MPVRVSHIIRSLPRRISFGIGALGLGLMVGNAACNKTRVEQIEDRSRNSWGLVAEDFLRRVGIDPASSDLVSRISDCYRLSNGNAPSPEEAIRYEGRGNKIYPPDPECIGRALRSENGAAGPDAGPEAGPEAAGLKPLTISIDPLEVSIEIPLLKRAGIIPLDIPLPAGFSIDPALPSIFIPLGQTDVRLVRQPGIEITLEENVLRGYGIATGSRFPRHPSQPLSVIFELFGSRRTVKDGVTVTESGASILVKLNILQVEPAVRRPVEEGGAELPPGDVEGMFSP